MKIINGNALVEIIKKEQVLSSGIIVAPDELVDDEGIVLDIDPEVSHIVNVGDRVKFNPNNGHDFQHKGKRCKFLKVFDKDSPRTDIIFCYGNE
jgi:co-chaperonin GroES (HSP10)